MTYLDDVQDGDSILNLPQFYLVRESGLALGCDGVSFWVGRNVNGVFAADDSLTKRMLDRFASYEKCAETFYCIATWMRIHD